MLPTAPIRGDFPSLKLGRMVRYGSTIECDLLYFLEYRRAVRWYREQPFTFEQVLADGKSHCYTPDYEIHEGNEHLLVECKPEARLESAQAQQQRQIGQMWAETNGYHFVTYTETELRAGEQLNNLKLLWRYARLRHCPEAPRILTQVREHGTSTMEHTSAHYADSPSSNLLDAVSSRVGNESQPSLYNICFHLGNRGREHMARIKLEPGIRYVYRQQLWRIQQRLTDEGYQVENLNSGETEQIRYEDILVEWAIAV